MAAVSIIVPVYRVEKYIRRCVESLINQTLKDIEIILIDDGSPDKSGDICDEYALKDSRIKVIHQKNAGVAVARNKGLDFATGKYITFIDSDDYVETNMYEKMMDKALEYDCDIVMCDCVKEFGDHTEVYSHNIRFGYYDRQRLKNEYFKNLLIMPYIEYPPTISNWLCLFKKSVVTDNSLHYEVGIRYSEDLLFGAQLVYHANSFYYMKGKTFYHYNCTNQQSATHTFVQNKWDDYSKLYKKIREYFENDRQFDFIEQIYKVLLFFVYNAVGDLYSVKEFSDKNKLINILNILNEPDVRDMFDKINIMQLPISKKQKIITYCYKYRVGIRILIKYYR